MENKKEVLNGLWLQKVRENDGISIRKRKKPQTYKVGAPQYRESRRAKTKAK